MKQALVLLLTVFAFAAGADEARRDALLAELEAEGESVSALDERADRGLSMPPVVAESVTAPRAGGGSGGAFSRAVVWFYRTFVGSAIGNRCALYPSCSRYFLEACRKHGWLGVPLMTDRFVREPVESVKDEWVLDPAGHWKHPDPVEAHDFWMEDGTP